MSIKRLSVIKNDAPHSKPWAITDGVMILPWYTIPQDAQRAAHRLNVYRTRLAYGEAYRQVRINAALPACIQPVPQTQIEEAAHKSFSYYWGWR